MENEKLSNAFIQKYEPLTDSFVVVENHINRQEQTQAEEKKHSSFFSFFRPRQRENVDAMHDNGQPTQPTPAQPPQPTQTPESNSAVVLSRDAYNKSRILKSLYQNLALSIPQCEKEFNELAQEMAVIESTLLSIYQSLSGNNYAPEQNQPAVNLTGNIETDIGSAKTLLQDLTNDVLALQRVVNVPSIDRQLAIISTTLVSQANRLNSMSAGGNNAN